MRRLLTTFDLLQAHVIASMLREHGVAASVFDADFVRQNWFQMFAYGGFRVMVPDVEFDAAREVYAQYNDGAFALPDEDKPACPRCGAARGVENPVPRRLVFVAMIFVDLMLSVLLVVSRRSIGASALYIFGTIAFLTMFPLLALQWFKWRYRCEACRFAWRQVPAQNHSELSRLAEAALGNSAD